MTNSTSPSKRRLRSATSPPRLQRRLPAGSRGRRRSEGWPASHGARTADVHYDFQPGAAHLCANLRLLLLPQRD